MNAVLARRVKIVGFQVVAETVEHQTQETFGDTGGEENGPELSGRISWFSEFVVWMEKILENFQKQHT